MIKQEDRNIVFITDENQCLFTLTNVLFINRGAKKKVNINLVFMDIKLTTKELIKKIIKINNLTNLQTLYLKSNNFELGKSLPVHITLVANLRLYLASIFPEIKSILYLDADTIVSGDINEIFDHVSYNKHYAVMDSLNSKRKQTLVRKKFMEQKKEYVNSGVMFLSLENIRKFKMEEKLTEFLNSNTLLYADQDTVNCLLNFEYLPWFYNDGKKTFPKVLDELYEQRRVHIYHYLMFAKQWGINWPAFTIYKKEKLKVKKEWKSSFKGMLKGVKNEKTNS